MPNISVDYEAVRSAAARLTAGKNEMETQLTQLKNLIDGLVASGFRTDLASHKFSASYDHQWHTGTVNAVAGLDGMASFLNTVVAQHENLDSTLSNAGG